MYTEIITIIMRCVGGKTKPGEIDFGRTVNQRRRRWRPNRQKSKRPVQPCHINLVVCHLFRYISISRHAPHRQKVKNRRSRRPSSVQSREQRHGPSRTGSRTSNKSETWRAATIRRQQQQQRQRRLNFTILRRRRRREGSPPWRQCRS